MNKIFDFSATKLSDFWSGNLADIQDSGKCIQAVSLKHEFFPVQALDEFELCMDLLLEEFGEIIISASPYSIVINGDIQTSICRTFGGNTITQSFDLKLHKAIVNKLKITYSKGCINVTLNKNLLKFESDYKPFITGIGIYLPAKSSIHKLEIGGQLSDLRLRPSQNMSASTTFDFCDDMAPEPFTQEMLNSAFQKISEMGIRRVYWIHHGDRNSGFWLSLGEDRICENFITSFNNLGNNFLSKATEFAHNHGIEIFAVLKPFDMSIMGKTFPANSDMAKKYGKNDIIGGKAYCCFDYVAEHPELCMQRRHQQTSANYASPTKIEINFNGPDVPQADVRLWTSEYNDKYIIHEQELVVDRKPGKIIISELNLKNNYLAIELIGNSAFQCGNLLKDMVRAYDKTGKLIECTLGLKPRKISIFDKDTNHLNVAIKKISFDHVGFDFDGLRWYVPSGVLCGDAALNHYHQFDSENTVIGIAVGVNQYVPGAMCPSEPEAISYRLNLIQEALDCGVDGVDIRVSSHLDILKWDQYGFNAPIVKEYQKRFGINILEHDFDKSLLRKLRGEYFTEFLKIASQLIRRHAKKVQFHIEDVMEGSADNSTMMEIYWDWQKWIDELRPDGITFKPINIDSHTGYYAIKVVEKCKEQNIPVDCCVFTHCIKDCRQLCDSLRNIGFSSVNLYEFASYYKAQGGKIIPLQEKLIADVKKYTALEQ